MSFTVFLGNLPAWVTADDIRGWLAAENLVADAIKVIRNPETQESKGFAFIDAPNSEEMNSIIRRFDRAPLEDRLLRANPAQPPKPKSSGGRPAGGPGFSGGPGGPSGGHGGYADRRPHQSSGYQPQGYQPRTQQPQGQPAQGPPSREGQPSATHEEGSAQASDQAVNPAASQTPAADQRPPRRGKRAGGKKPGSSGPNSAFAEELAKAL